MERESLLSHMDKRFDRLDSRLEQMDLKLDDHLGRISKTEAEVAWIKGASKFALTLVLSVLGLLANWLIKRNF